MPDKKQIPIIEIKHSVPIPVQIPKQTKWPIRSLAEGASFAFPASALSTIRSRATRLRKELGWVLVIDKDPQSENDYRIWRETSTPETDPTLTEGGK